MRALTLAVFVRVLTSLIGAAIVVGAGWTLVRFTIGLPLVRLSYDVPLWFRSAPTDEVCIVYMDENAGRALGQRSGVWDRTLHAALLRRLSRDGARAVMFDLTFLDPADEPAKDDDFAAAIAEHGSVFLAAPTERERTNDGYRDQVLPPIDKLADAAADYGLVSFLPDPDHGVRTLDTGNELMPSCTWLMAHELGAQLGDHSNFRAQQRWLNYYGEAGTTFAGVDFHRALQPDGVRPGYFSGRVVFVGGRSTVGTVGLGKDDFAQPHTRWTKRFVSGVEIHATAFLNLLRGEWLTRWAPETEELFNIFYGLLLVHWLPRLNPRLAAIIAVGSASIVAVGAWWLVWERLVWFAWAVPALVQTPLALAWAITARYVLEERKRIKLRNAFKQYVSASMADRVVSSECDLTPGGEVVEATIIFTDLQGFSHLSEDLDDPKKLSDVLIAYFTATTQHVYECNGTVIKFIGDAVLAVWGAPVPDPNHHVNGTLAAWRMYQASEQEVLGRRLVTRVGVHSGRVLAGNLGSAYRFDYTVIGDAVNFASRLEALNKYLGTKVLVSDATIQRCNEFFLTRPLGQFRVAGKDRSLAIHELLGPMACSKRELWVDCFESGRIAFGEKDWPDAERCFRQVCALRGGHDGPSAFYLRRIDELRSADLPVSWSGVIELDSK